MTRNIIIILVSLGIVGWNLFVFKRRATFSKSSKKIALIILALWVITTFLPNIPILLSPLTPQIHGKVIDAETKQPIANCNIQAYWQTESFFIAGAHWEAYESFYAKCNSKGEFIIPRYQRALEIFVCPTILKRNWGEKIIVFDHGHKSKEFNVTNKSIQEAFTANVQPISQVLTIQMIPIKKPETYFQNLFDLNLNVFSDKNYQKAMPSHFKEFNVESYNYLIKHFPNINCEIYRNGELEYLAKKIEDAGIIDKAIEVQEQIKKVCPSKAALANEEIARLKIKQTKGL